MCFFGSKAPHYTSADAVSWRRCVVVWDADSCPGELATDGSVLYVSNHVSYLDVFVLGVKVPASFIAKAEVAGWPVFGSLAK